MSYWPRIKKLYTAFLGMSIVEAMKRIDANAKGIVYVIDEDGRLFGSLTDGDIRRWIIKGGSLHEEISKVCFRETKFLFESEVDKASSFMTRYGLHSVPILNTERRIVDIIFEKEETGISGRESNILSSTPVVIMAGGKGTRLYPYTKILPKPLIPIGEIPILERILSAFNKYGASVFTIVVNYKRAMIKAYFAEQNLPYHIDFVDEEQPLGTAGGIRLVKDKFSSPVVVTNCDILIQTNYEKIIEYHKSSNNDMTIVTSLKNTVIPYGVISSVNAGQIISMEEKPQISTFINTGMYILNPEFINWIPENQVFHMTDLANKMIDAKKRVGMYPISENSFLDMGEFEEMKKMEDRISTTYS